MSTPSPNAASTDTQRPVGADVVLRALESEGVKVCFGMPGGAVLPLYDALVRGTSIRHVLVRHEQGAGHMAQGYARASGRAGVVFATSGPGATNLVTPIADAMMDSTPMVCITGQVRSGLLGTDAFQECDITGITMPVVKHSWLVTEVQELPGIVHEAFAIATSGRPGPVLIDIPRDVQETPASPGQHTGPARHNELEPYPDPGALRAAAGALRAAQRPLLYAGGGAQSAADALSALARRGDIPVVATLMGKGAFPESDPLFCGWPGMHGCVAANRAMHHADVIVAAGARFDDRVTGDLASFAPETTIVHIDIDRYELNKIRRADVALHADLRLALAGLASELDQPCNTAEWRARIKAWHSAHPLAYDRTGESLKPQAVLERVAEATRTQADVVWTTGVGQHQMWAMQYLPVDRPRSFVTSGGHGTMGFGLPAAIGAKAARSDATVVCVDGDGSFQMTLQELATAVSARLPVIVLVLNNGQLGMVHQWQSMFYAERLSQVDLSADMPDLAAIARGFGALGFTVSTRTELDAALDEALLCNRPAVLDVRVDPAERCFPIIPPGKAAVDQLEWASTS